jgi:Rrf2 family iron-sulfur cluster assembly transcriptional regulator
MNLTTKGRYAVMAMVDLAINGKGNPVSLADIAARQDIALSYLEQIFMRLRKAGLVKSVRGPGGGYIIAAKPEDMPISDIVIAVDESIKMTRCGNENKSGCISDHNKSKCITHNLWEGLSNKIYEYLHSISLADVCNRNVYITRRPGLREEANA